MSSFADHFSRRAPRTQPRWTWRHALVANLLMDATQFGLARLVGAFRPDAAITPEAIRAYYASQVRPRFSPPGWAFLPAWILNRVFATAGVLRVLNKPEASRGRREFLLLQALSWLDFTVWTATTFALRSPINALVLSVLFLVFTVLSGLVALFRLRDTAVAWSLATLFLWLLVATASAYPMALWNRDEWYRVGPFARPGPGEARG